MSKQERDKLVWNAVPMHAGKGIWIPVRNTISELCGDRIPPRQLVYAVMTTYWTRNISAATTPSSDVRHVNMLRHLVGRSRATCAVGGQQGYAGLEPHTDEGMDDIQDGETYEGGYTDMGHVDDQGDTPMHDDAALEHAAYGDESMEPHD